MTVDDVQARLDEACRTLARLQVSGLYPNPPNRSAWPPFVQDFWERFAALVDPATRAEHEAEIERITSKSEIASLGPPTAEQISRMDEAFEWFALVRDERHRKCLWQISLMRARGLYDHTSRLARRQGVHRNTINGAYSRALGDIASSIN